MKILKLLRACSHISFEKSIGEKTWIISVLEIRSHCSLNFESDKEQNYWFPCPLQKDFILPLAQLIIKKWEWGSKTIRIDNLRKKRMIAYNYKIR